MLRRIGLTGFHSKPSDLAQFAYEPFLEVSGKIELLLGDVYQSLTGVTSCRNKKSFGLAREEMRNVPPTRIGRRHPRPDKGEEWGTLLYISYILAS